MRLVSSHTSEAKGPRESDRIVRLYTGGIREVVHCCANGEYWSRYIIVPRRLILNEIRKLRAKGAIVIGQWDFWELLPEGASELIRSERYSGPGQSFTHRPCRVKSSRKYIVIHQSGGLDI